MSRYAEYVLVGSQDPKQTLGNRKLLKTMKIAKTQKSWSDHNRGRFLGGFSHGLCPECQN